MIKNDVHQSILHKAMPIPRTRKLSWRRGRKLGDGSSGCVYLAESVYDGSVVAVKSAELSCSKSLKKEAKLLLKFASCPHIIRCFGAETTKRNGVKLHNVFLEYAPGGTLADCIKKFKNGVTSNEGLPEDEVKKLTRSLLSGLSFIHGYGYVHRDIKPDNILIDGAGNAKIADFGLAKNYNKENKQGKGGYCIGTPLYMAPEIVNEEVYEPPVDIWALGCTVIEMITGKPAWDFPSDAEGIVVMYQIGSAGSPPEIPEGLSKEAVDFLEKCLAVAPKERWTAEMLLNHPFVAACYL